MSHIRKHNYSSIFYIACLTIALFISGCNTGKTNGSTTATGGNTDPTVLGIAAPTQLKVTVDSTKEALQGVNQFSNNDPMQSSLQVSNTLLCMIGLTNYSQFTNKGPTTADVNLTLCQKSYKDAQSSAPNYFRITYNATRENNSSPESVVFWINGNVGTDILVKAIMHVNEEPSTANPNGVFDFTNVAYLSSDITTPYITGYIDSEIGSGGPQIVFYQAFNGVQTGSFIGSGTEAGYGKSFAQGGGGSNNSSIYYTLDYNHNYLLELAESGLNAGGSQVCYNRSSTTNYFTQYGVYNQDGSPLTNPAVDGTNVIGYSLTVNGNDGYLNYNGLYLPKTTSESTGSPVQYQAQNVTTSSTGTLYLAGGLMNLVTPTSVRFQDVSGTVFMLSINGNSNQSDLISWSSENGGEFQLVGQESFNNTGSPTITSFTPPYAVFDAESFANLANITVYLAPGAESGVGVVQLIPSSGASDSGTYTVFESCSVSNSNPGKPMCDTNTYQKPVSNQTLELWQNAVIAPSSSPSQTLYCLQTCPVESDNKLIYLNPAMNGNSDSVKNESGESVPYITYLFTQTAGSSTAPIYSLKTVNMESQYNNQTITSNESGYFRSGHLLTEDTYSAIATENTPPNMNSSYYEWRTGGSNTGNNFYGNKFIGIDDANGDLLQIAPPMLLIYESTNDSNFLLQYFGINGLVGYPSICRSSSDGAQVDGSGGCNGGNFWVPTTYNIPENSSARDISGSSYTISPTSIYQLMNIEESSVCAGNPNNLSLSAARQVLLPESTGYNVGGIEYTYVVPNIGTAPTGLPVSVINGTNQP